MTSNVASAVSGHYAGSDLMERVTDALRQAGKHEGRLGVEELAPLDQFHIRGREATLELAELAELAQLGPGLEVLDIGGGLGGPARTLAVELGCRVTVLDITEAYCRVGTMLTQRTGLADLVSFRVGDALDAPFPDRSFDVVWTQHSNMNIEDKERLYGEVYRLLRDPGKLAIHEIVAGSKPVVHFPVPWAGSPEISFLRTAPELVSAIEGKGFECIAFREITETALAWFRQRASGGGEPPPLGLHLLLGERFASAFRNVLLSLEEQRVGVIAAVFRK